MELVSEKASVTVPDEVTQVVNTTSRTATFIATHWKFIARKAFFFGSGVTLYFIFF